MSGAHQIVRLIKELTIFYQLKKFKMLADDPNVFIATEGEQNFRYCWMENQAVIKDHFVQNVGRSTHDLPTLAVLKSTIEIIEKRLHFFAVNKEHASRLVDQYFRANVLKQAWDNAKVSIGITVSVMALMLLAKWFIFPTLPLIYVALSACIPPVLGLLKTGYHYLYTMPLNKNKAFEFIESFFSAGLSGNKVAIEAGMNAPRAFKQPTPEYNTHFFKPDASAASQDNDLKSVAISKACYKTWPCEHDVVIQYEDGRKETEMVDAITIQKNYGFFLTGCDKRHFGMYRELVSDDVLASRQS